VSDCDGSRWEGALGDGFAQDREGWRENIVLMLEGLNQRRRSLDGEVQDGDTLPESLFRPF
jgi:hypothetical protein